MRAIAWLFCALILSSGGAFAAAQKQSGVSGCVASGNNCVILRSGNRTFALSGSNLPQPGSGKGVVVRGTISPGGQCFIRAIITGTVAVTSWRVTRRKCPAG